MNIKTKPFIRWLKIDFFIDFTEVTKAEMIAASVASASCNNGLLEELLYKCLTENK